MDIFEWITAIIIAIFIFICGIFIYAIITGQTPQARHYKECLDDGNKEYVCWSMIYGNGSKVK